MRGARYYFDANGEIGSGTRKRAEFEDCHALIAHMDRLGITRSMVWNRLARDHHPGLGNRRLLAEWEGLKKEERERLTPSLVIGPNMMHEEGEVEELIAQMKKHHIRGLRVFPGTMRFKLHHLEPLLKKLAALKPVVMVDVREVGSDLELDGLAEAFPKMAMVAMYGMWPHLFNWGLLDALRRNKNLMIDTSWEHTGGTMEMALEKFGRERVIFATGIKAHNGASIARLATAEIDEETKESIAHGRLEKLLGLKEWKGEARQPKKDSLWGRYLAGGKIGAEIIDAHVHYGANGVWPRGAVTMEEFVELGVREMDRAGIAASIVSSTEALFGKPLEGNLLLEEKAKKHKGRVMGYMGFHPLYRKELEPRIEEFFGRGFFVGFKTLCDYWGTPVTHEDFAPMLEYADRHRLPILYHTWDGNCDSPAMLKDVVKKYPGAFFLLGHSGGFNKGRAEAVALAKGNKNVYLEWCGSFCADTPWEETIREVGSDRVVFGTDTLGHSIDWELGRLMSVDLPEKEILPILGGNMRRILGARR